jgi:hypothetical protein
MPPLHHQLIKLDMMLLFYFSGNFLSGDFIQDTADITSLRSNLALNQTAFNASHAFLLDSAAITGSGNRTAYGNAAAAQKALRVTATTYNDMTVGTTQNIDTYVHINGADAIPMISQDGARPEGDELSASDTSVGDALLNAVSQALFKKMGKNAALNNDTDIKTDLQNKLYQAINSAVREENVSYSSSKYFKRYLDSGRYLSDSDANVDELKPYTVNDTVIHALVNISGSVTDSDSGPDLSVTANSERIFGNPSADPAETQVTDGSYTTHILVALRQDDRL